MGHAAPPADILLRDNAKREEKRIQSSIYSYAAEMVYRLLYVESRQFGQWVCTKSRGRSNPSSPGQVPCTTIGGSSLLKHRRACTQPPPGRCEQKVLTMDSLSTLLLHLNSPQTELSQHSNSYTKTVFTARSVTCFLQGASYIDSFPPHATSGAPPESTIACLTQFHC